MPDYDPLTISDEELKKLPAAERGAVYKARRAAATGGAAPAPAAAGPAAQTPPPVGSPPPTGAATPATGTPAAAAPATGTPAAAAPAAGAETPSPVGSPSSTGTGAAAGAATPATGTPPTGTPTAAATGTPAAAAAPRPAAPAAPAPPKEPEKPAFAERLLNAVPDSTFQWRHGYAEVKIPRQHLLQAARQLKAEGFDYLSFITEVDWQQHLELLYHLFSYDYRAQPLGMILRTELPREGMPEVASLTSVWPGAEFMEREAFEMMGIVFLGHPDLRRILLPDDFVGFPMRRDYETDWDYITVKQLVHEGD